jgi:tetratricopeptide (TPR) repeat protein
VLIKVYPNNPYYFFYRGVAEFSNNELDSALTDFLKPLNMPKNEVTPNAAYNAAVVYDKMGDGPNAYKYIVIAKQAGQQIDTAFYNSLQKKKNLHIITNTNSVR